MILCFRVKILHFQEKAAPFVQKSFDISACVKIEHFFSYFQTEATLALILASTSQVFPWSE